MRPGGHLQTAGGELRGSPSALNFRVAGKCVVWRVLVDLVAPLGYEDEEGFHYGEMPKNASRQRTPPFAVRRRCMPRAGRLRRRLGTRATGETTAVQRVNRVRRDRPFFLPGAARMRRW